MRKYDFDYLVNKVQTINEMARPRVYQKLAVAEPESPFGEFDEIYVATGRKMKGIGGNVQRMLLDYLIINFYYAINQEDLSVGGAANLSGQFAKENKEEYINWVNTYKKEKEGTTDPMIMGNYKKDFYLYHLIKTHPEIVKSPEFRQNTLDENNIKSFIDNPGGYDASGQSITAGFHKQRKENLYGKELGDIYQIQAQAHPLLIMINKMMRRKRRENWQIDDEKASPAAHLAKNIAEELSFILPYTSNSQQSDEGGSLFAQKETEQDKTSNPRKYFGKKFTTNDIDQLIGFLEEREENGVGLTEEQWVNLINKMKVKDPNIAELGQYLLQVSQQEKEQNIDESDEFEGYDREVLAKVLDTPEKEDIFRSWYELKQAEADRQSEIDEKRFASAMKKHNKFMRSGSGVEHQIEELMIKAEESDDPGEIRRIKKHIERLQKKREWEAKKEENGVMGYMTEQVFKDSFTDKRGKFVDRGFKKPVNYAHWLDINGD